LLKNGLTIFIFLTVKLVLNISNVVIFSPSIIKNILDLVLSSNFISKYLFYLDHFHNYNILNNDLKSSEVFLNLAKSISKIHSQIKDLKKI
jgi:hypothetical protein